MAALAVAVSILAPDAVAIFDERQRHCGSHPRPAGWILRQWDFSCYAHLLSLALANPGRCFSRAGQQRAGGRWRDAGLVVAGDPCRLQLSRYPGRDAGWLYAGLGIYMVPPVAFVLPLSILFSNISGLLNTRSGLVLGLLLA